MSSFASGRPVRGFLGGDFRFQAGERLCFVTIGPSFYLQIEAPVKHKHYRPAGKKKEGNAARYVTRSQVVKQLQDFINRLEAQPTIREQKGSKHVSAEDLAA